MATRAVLCLFSSTMALALSAGAFGQIAANPRPTRQAAWVATFGGAQPDRVLGVERAAGGGHLLAGTTFSNGPAAGSLWVASIDVAGRARWEVALFGAKGSAFGSMVAAPDGGCVVVGQITDGAGEAGWIVRLTGRGAIAWQKSYRGPGQERFTAVARSPRGYYVGGVVAQSPLGLHDACVLEVDGAGNVLWQKRLAGDLEEQLKSIAATADGVAVTIDSQSSFPGVAAAPFFRPWLVKLDQNGNVLWQKTYDFSGGDAWNHLLAVPGGGFLATGEIISMGFFRGDVWLVRLDDDGKVLWDQRYGDNNMIPWVDSGARAVATAGGGFAVLGSTGTAGAGSEDLWLLQVDAQGALQWSRTYGREGFDGGHALARFENGDLLLAGFSQFYGNGSQDGFALRVRANGATMECAGGASTQPNQWTSPLQIDTVSVSPTDLSLVEGTPAVSVVTLNTAALTCTR